MLAKDPASQRLSDLSSRQPCACQQLQVQDGCIGEIGSKQARFRVPYRSSVVGMSSRLPYFCESLDRRWSFRCSGVRYYFGVLQHSATDGRCDKVCSESRAGDAPLGPWHKMHSDVLVPINALMTSNPLGSAAQISVSNPTFPLRIRTGGVHSRFCVNPEAFLSRAHRD
jgi:hypothetical protein